MCGRFTPVSREELVDIAREIDHERIAAGLRFSPVLEKLTEQDLGRARQEREPHDEQLALFELETPQPKVPSDAFPGSVVPVLAIGENGLSVAEFTWGFSVPWNKGPVFNTRIETALSSKRNMWTDPLHSRRCLIASTGFYETSTETIANPKTGRQMKKQFRFTLPDSNLLFMAGVYEAGCFSIMTCSPNQWVEGIHPRMPIALQPDEAPLWLTDDFLSLVDRRSLALNAR